MTFCSFLAATIITFLVTQRNSFQQCDTWSWDLPFIFITGLFFLKTNCTRVCHVWINFIDIFQYFDRSCHTGQVCLPNELFNSSIPNELNFLPQIVSTVERLPIDHSSEPSIDDDGEISSKHEVNNHLLLSESMTLHCYIFELLLDTNNISEKKTWFWTFQQRRWWYSPIHEAKSGGTGEDLNFSNWFDALRSLNVLKYYRTTCFIVTVSCWMETFIFSVLSTIGFIESFSFKRKKPTKFC